MGRKQAQTLLAALISWPLAAQDYNPATIPPQIIGSPQTMTPLNGGDDSTRLVQLGFPFEYYGQVYTSVWVSTNGLVSFQGGNHLCCDGQPIEQAQRNTIYGFWTDLISGGNPYYRTNNMEAVFGWYNTFEYGTNLANTFEIALFPDGKIQWNYGDVNNQYHRVTAGLTGPTIADSISLFYGQNPNLLDNTSYIAGVPAPQPEPEPEQMFDPVDVIPDGVFNPIEETAQETVAEVVQEEVVEEQPVIEEMIEEAVEEAIAETEEVAEIIDEPVEEEVADVVEEEEVAEEEDAERLTPDELAALAAGGDDAIGSEEGPTASDISNAINEVAKDAQSAEDARQATQGPLGANGSIIGFNGPEGRSDNNVLFFQREAIEDADTFRRETVLAVRSQDVAFVANADAQYAQMNGPQTTTDTVAETYSLMVVDGPTFAPPPVTGMVADTTSPSSQSQQMELLNMSGMQGEMSAGPTIDVGDVNTGDGETMAQLAVVPVGYSSYTQARIPDLPFYQPKDIYKGRRIPDANMALYRMMRGQDQLWDDMVEDQYE